MSGLFEYRHGRQQVLEPGLAAKLAVLLCAQPICQAAGAVEALRNPNSAIHAGINLRTIFVLSASAARMSSTSRSTVHVMVPDVS